MKWTHFARLDLVLASGLLSLVCLSVTGCKSADKPASARFASVVIHGNTPGQIAETAMEVFQEHGYKPAEPGMYRLLFEKQGSAMNNVAYGNWMGETIWNRVRVEVEQIAPTASRLQCHAFLVRDRGGTTEEEIKVSSVRSGPYQKILEEVALKLGSPAR